MNAPEPPGLDGSARGFVAALRGSGTVLQPARRLRDSAIEMNDTHVTTYRIVDGDPLVSVVVPVYNEEKTVGQVVGELLELPLRLVDAGGGLGIPYGPTDRPLDLAAFGAAFWVYCLLVVAGGLRLPLPSPGGSADT